MRPKFREPCILEISISNNQNIMSGEVARMYLRLYSMLICLKRIMILLHCWVINCALGKPTAAQAVSATFNDESRGRNSDQQIVVQALYPPSTTRLDMTSYKTAVQPDGPLLHNGLSDQGAFQAPTARMAHVSPTQPSPARKAPPSSYNTRSKSKPNARDILGYEDVDEEEISHHDQPESPIESENDDDCDSVIGATRTRDGGRKRSRDSERDTRDGHCKRNKMVVVFKLPIETLPGVREEHRDDVLQPDTPLGVEAYVGQPSTSGRRPDHRTSPTRSTSPTATVASDQQTTSFIDQQDHDPAGSPPAVSQVSEMELERVRFQLSQALQAINRSPHPDIHSFKILDALIGNNTRDLENAVREKLQGRYAVLRSAYTRWRTFHNRLGDFWSRIEFNGGTREEYKAYKSELSKPDRLRLDIFAAAQDLKDWQRKKKEDRQWMRVDTFDQELANFFFELFEDDNWSPEDLQIHLEGYNRELLSWFI
ncbi:hypothetical protein BDV96DRAFT_355098 [Lophiotrema nucula]|uniref:Uncharacterized protein n=1 Tax=Lophiotrema nucula TaxID=690887 RepID=A0A6A5YHP1_9PLEO|nr:hypothetical protein BDV96DRAFT_355098 [Lophiotrema nucula]